MCIRDRYGLEGYKYHATNYIIKPLKYARLKSEMDKFVERSTPEGSVTYVLDKSRLSIRLVPPYSEERKAAARELSLIHI